MSLRAANRLKHVKIDTAASADLIAATQAASATAVGQKIRVVSYVLVAAAPVTAKFQSGGTTDLSGAMSLIAGTPLAVQGNVETPILECKVGEKLNLVLGGAVQVSGHITYEIVQATP